MNFRHYLQRRIDPERPIPVVFEDDYERELREKEGADNMISSPRRPSRSTQNAPKIPVPSVRVKENSNGFAVPPFVLPSSYIKYTHRMNVPVVSDDYTMEGDDYHWLEKQNIKAAKNGWKVITCDEFEAAMDQLERKQGFSQKCIPLELALKKTPTDSRIYEYWKWKRLRRLTSEEWKKFCPSGRPFLRRYERSPPAEWEDDYVAFRENMPDSDVRRRRLAWKKLEEEELLEKLTTLRNDLVRVRNIVRLVKIREIRKRERIQMLPSVLELQIQCSEKKPRQEKAVAVPKTHYQNRRTFQSPSSQKAKPLMKYSSYQTQVFYKLHLNRRARPTALFAFRVNVTKRDEKEDEGVDDVSDGLETDKEFTDEDKDSLFISDDEDNEEEDEFGYTKRRKGHPRRNVACMGRGGRVWVDRKWLLLQDEKWKRSKNV